MGMIDSKMEKLRYGDEYQGLSEFAKKVRTINFNFNDDNINGVFEVDDGLDYAGEFENCNEHDLSGEQL